MMIKILKILFNKIIKIDKSPADWSKMIITPILKKGDTLNAENYKAIAIQYYYQYQGKYSVKS